MRRAVEELSLAFPGAAISGIENPISFGGKECHQVLLTRDGRHSIAENDGFLLFSRTRWGQEFGQNFSLESGSEHSSFCGLFDFAATLFVRRNLHFHGPRRQQIPRFARNDNLMCLSLRSRKTARPWAPGVYGVIVERMTHDRNI